MGGGKRDSWWGHYPPAPAVYGPGEMVAVVRQLLAEVLVTAAVPDKRIGYHLAFSLCSMRTALDSKEYETYL